MMIGVAVKIVMTVHPRESNLQSNPKVKSYKNKTTAQTMKSKDHLFKTGNHIMLLIKTGIMMKDPVPNVWIAAVTQTAVALYPNTAAVVQTMFCSPFLHGSSSLSGSLIHHM